MNPQLDHPSPSVIPVCEPCLRGNEKRYVKQCLDENWISSQGRFLDAFEQEFAAFCGVEHGIACCNGTVALHLALAALEVGPGDEVLVPDLTFVATANAVRYCGATPVLVDCESDTWNIDPVHAEKLITPRTKGIIPVHLFGLPADMDRIGKIAEKHDLFVIEDAAEAHGAVYQGRRAGSLGRMGVFSFYGNKIITTGEGGMVVTSDATLAKRLRMLRGQGMDPQKRYWFPLLGYNYRMTNIAAAIGLGQLEDIEWHMAQRDRVDATYRQMLGSIPEIVFQPDIPGIRHAHWSTGVVIQGTTEARRDAIMAAMRDHGVDTRPFFYPMHAMPPYRQDPVTLPHSSRTARSGIMLPSYATLEEATIGKVCGAFVTSLNPLGGTGRDT